MKKKIYISGPMSGLPEFNMPAFHGMAEFLKKMGWIVLNPAVFPEGLEYHEYMQLDLVMVGISDAVMMLGGWENSPGAKAEFALAQSLKKEILYQRAPLRD